MMYLVLEFVVDFFIIVTSKPWPECDNDFHCVATRTNERTKTFATNNKAETVSLRSPWCGWFSAQFMRRTW